MKRLTAAGRFWVLYALLIVVVLLAGCGQVEDITDAVEVIPDAIEVVDDCKTIIDTVKQCTDQGDDFLIAEVDGKYRIFCQSREITQQYLEI